MTLAVKALHHHKHFPAQTLKGLSQKNVVAVLEGNYSVISVHGGMSVMVARRGRNIKEVGGMAWLSASGRMFFWGVSSVSSMGHRGNDSIDPPFSPLQISSCLPFSARGTCMFVVVGRIECAACSDISTVSSSAWILFA